MKVERRLRLRLYFKQPNPNSSTVIIYRQPFTGKTVWLDPDGYHGRLSVSYRGRGVDISDAWFDRKTGEPLYADSRWLLEKI